MWNTNESQPKPQAEILLHNMPTNVRKTQEAVAQEGRTRRRSLTQLNREHQMPETITVDVEDSMSEITPNLRWRNGILQQGWIVTHYKSGVPHKRTIEWRDVPTEDDQHL